MQEEILSLKESAEEFDHDLLVIFVGKNFVDDRDERLAEIEVKVLDQNVLLLSNRVSKIDFFENTFFCFDLCLLYLNSHELFNKTFNSY